MAARHIQAQAERYFGADASAAAQPKARAAGNRPRMRTWKPWAEQLEDRTVPSAVVFGDFNRDGFVDLAVGNAQADVLRSDGSIAAGAGVVHVEYGSAVGFTGTGGQTWTQDALGWVDNRTGAETSEAGDGFGESLTVGDFNGDGFTDLVIGVPHEDLTQFDFQSNTWRTFPDTGGVHVIYGSSAGLTTTGSQFWHQDSPGLQHGNGGGDLFGFALAAGDFNRDGFTDLAVGMPGNRAGSGNPAGAGGVSIIYGSAAGVTATGNRVFAQNTSGISDTPEAGDQFGYALAAADFNADGFADLAIGVPFEDLELETTVIDAGVVHILFGAADGLSATNSQYRHLAQSGMPTLAAAGDQFGFALAAGDFNGDGWIDLAVGGPGRDVGTAVDAGMVVALYGNADKGPRAAGSQVWFQGTAGLADAPEAGDRFGAVLAAGNFNGDAYGDLAAGLPSEDIGTIVDAGAVQVLYGSNKKLTATGSQFWFQSSGGLPDRAELDDYFGAALGVADIDRDGRADLAVYIPGEDVGGRFNTGAVNLVRGSATGLTVVGSQLWLPPAATNQSNAVAAGSVWKYLDNGANLGTAWKEPAFDDSAWKSGAAQLGYGDGDEATVVGYGPDASNKYITTYFRLAFNVDDPASISALLLNLLRDDGAVVYLNGVEVYRSNLPAGTITYTTRASSDASGADEDAWFSTSISPGLLVSGTNVLAVEIHQRSGSSSDLSFDLALKATGA